MTFALTYTPADINDGKRLKDYIEATRISTNSYLYMMKDMCILKMAQ